jgi:hypothetical protein
MKRKVTTGLHAEETVPSKQRKGMSNSLHAESE